MAERNLESNIVLQTVLPLPKGNGFQSLHSQLNKIETKLTKLTDRDWKIKVTLDDGGLSASNIRVTSTLKKTAKQAGKEAGKEAVSAFNQELDSAKAGLLTRIRETPKATIKTREGVSGGLQSRVDVKTTDK